MAEWQHQMLSWLPCQRRVRLLHQALPHKDSRSARTARALVAVVQLSVDELWHEDAWRVLREEDPLIKRHCYALALQSVRDAMLLLVRDDRMPRLERLEKELLQKATEACSVVGADEVSFELAVHTGKGIQALKLARDRRGKRTTFW